MLAVFIIIISVVVFTIIISIINKKQDKESGKHFSDNTNKDAQNINKISDSDSYKNVKKSYYDNVKAEHEADELKRKKQIEELNLFDKSIYDDLFSSGVKERGEEYFSDGKITNFSQENNKYTCKVNGTKQYNVQIIFSANNPDEIEKASCTCTYYTREHKYCKHIYALLYKAKCSKNREIIDNKFAKISSETADIITKSAKDVNENFDNYNRNIVKKFLKYTKYIQEQLEYWTSYYLNIKTENGKLNALQCLTEATDGVDSRINDFMIKMKDHDYADGGYYEEINDDFDDDDNLDEDYDEENEEEDSKTRLLKELAIDKMVKNIFNNNDSHE